MRTKLFSVCRQSLIYDQDLQLGTPLQLRDVNIGWGGAMEDKLLEILGPAHGTKVRELAESKVELFQANLKRHLTDTRKETATTVRTPPFLG